VVDEVASIIKQYKASAVLDQHTSVAIIERLKTYHGIVASLRTMTADTKSQIYASLREKLYSGELILPDNPLLIGELRRLRTRYAAGKATVDNPRVGGSHGDQAQALALACHEVATTVDLSHFADGPFSCFATTPRGSKWELQPAADSPLYSERRSGSRWENFDCRGY
jgi:hypothetical protein